MEHKALAVELKGNQAGAFRAIFATFNQVDHDGDVTLPGAFPVGAKIPIAGVGHNWDVPTIGNGTIGADSEKAWLDGRFNLKMDAGRETYESIKFDADEGVNAQQYSYAYDVGKGHSARPDEQKQWPGAKRVLEQLVPHEVSPVLLGAGIETGTAFVKGRRGRKAGPLSYEDRRDLLQEAVNAWDVAEDAAEGEPTEPFDMRTATYPIGSSSARTTAATARSRTRSTRAASSPSAMRPRSCRLDGEDPGHPSLAPADGYVGVREARARSGCDAREGGPRSLHREPRAHRERGRGAQGRDRAAPGASGRDRGAAEGRGCPGGCGRCTPRGWRAWPASSESH